MDFVIWLVDLSYIFGTLLIIYAVTLTKPYVAHYEVSYVKWNEDNYHEKHHIQHEVPMEITRTVNIKLIIYSFTR